MKTDATVLFCVGATKAGTSWLYRFLSAHPECHMRPIKELHYFDALDRDDTKWQIGRFRKLQRRLADAEDGQQKITAYDELIALLAKGRVDTAGYLGYLTKGRGAQKVVADVTPSYALLSAERFKSMAEMAAHTRFIYILRDPVARLWSHIRMKARNRHGRGGSMQDWANRIFWRMERGRNAGILERGDYRTVLENLRQAVDPKQMLVLFYEDLFTSDTINRICRFLGIAPHPADYAQAVNPGAKIEMTAEQRDVAYGWHAQQYEYVRSHFDAVPASWLTDKTRVKA